MVNSKLNIINKDKNSNDYFVFNLNDELDNKEVNNDLLYKFKLAVDNNSRRIRKGHYKSESGISCSRRKLRPQKGTGRARIGSAGSLRLRGGAVKFGYSGNRKKDFSRRYKKYLKVNKKEKTKLFIGVLANKITNNKLIIISKFSEFNKTKEGIDFLSSVNLFDEKVTLIYNSYDNIVAFRNIRKVTYHNCTVVNALDVMKAKYLIIEEIAMDYLLKILKVSYEFINK